MKSFHLICVGKLKDTQLEKIEADYLKRITLPNLTIHEVRAHAENKIMEGEAVTKKIREIEKDGIAYKIAMTEWGKTYNSIEFAHNTSKLLEVKSKIIFIIAGAEGFADQLLSICNERISLSSLTFPHKIARILLVEQLYRAQTIREGHPYHN